MVEGEPMRKHGPGDTSDRLPIPNYPADAFAGTAPYYARYRVPLCWLQT